jgi:hypothetical protein
LEAPLTSLERSTQHNELGAILAVLVGSRLHSGPVANPVPSDSTAACLIAQCALHPAALPGA